MPENDFVLRPFDEKDYEGFVCNLIKTWGLQNLNMEFVIFHDNLNVHHSTKKIIQELNISNITTIFNAPYSPMINPIELFFNKLKFDVRNSRFIHTKELLIGLFSILEK